MEDGLGGSLERDNGIRRTGGLDSKLQATEIERTHGKLSGIGELALQRDGSVLFRLTGCNSLRSKRLVMYRLNAFAQPKEIAHGKHGVGMQEIEERDHSARPALLQAAAQIGDDDNTLFLLLGKLGINLEGTQTFHLIAEEVYAEGVFGREGKDINDAATHGVLPRFINIIHILKAIAAQHFGDKVHVHLFGDVQFQRLVSQFLTRNDFFRQGIGIGHDT